MANQQKQAELQKLEIEKMQPEFATVEDSIQAKRTKLVSLRQQHLELAKQATVPPEGRPQEPIAAIGLDASALGYVLKQLGAGDQAMAMAEGVAKALPNIIKNATLSVVGTSRTGEPPAEPAAPGAQPAATAAQPPAPTGPSVADVEVGDLREMLRAAGMQIPGD